MYSKNFISITNILWRENLRTKSTNLLQSLRNILICYLELFYLFNQFHLDYEYSVTRKVWTKAANLLESFHDTFISVCLIVNLAYLINLFSSMNIQRQVNTLLQPVESSNQTVQSPWTSWGYPPIFFYFTRCPFIRFVSLILYFISMNIQRGTPFPSIESSISKTSGDFSTFLGISFPVLFSTLFSLLHLISSMNIHLRRASFIQCFTSSQRTVISISLGIFPFQNWH